MATVHNLAQFAALMGRTPAARPEAEQGVVAEYSAEIVIFPGVRYERWDGDQPPAYNTPAYDTDARCPLERELELDYVQSS